MRLFFWTTCVAVAALLPTMLLGQASCPSCSGSLDVIQDSGTQQLAPVPQWKFDATGTKLQGTSSTSLSTGTTTTGPTPPTGEQLSSQAYAIGVALQPNGTCVGNGCSPTLPSTSAGFTLFGDSVGCGDQATPAVSNTQFYSPNGFAWLAGPDFGGAFTNYCSIADWSEDLVREWAMPYAAPTESKSVTYMIEIGGNDANGKTCGSGTGCLSSFTYALQAAAAWLAIPTACKTYGQSSTQSQSSVGGVMQGATPIGGEPPQCGPIGPPSYSPAANWAADNFIYPGSSPPPPNYKGSPPVSIPGIAEYTPYTGSSITIPFTTICPAAISILRMAGLDQQHKLGERDTIN